MTTGSCLCGEVKFAIEGTLAPLQICHCGQCQKAQGSAFVTNTPVDESKLTFVAGG
ncbi:MAG: GFA family protein [Pseudomonadales bacterium]|nr:GFA family protein [Pseudomonadales bacterium]